MCVSIACYMGGGTAGGGSCYHLMDLLCFSKSLQVWKGGKRSHCKMTCHLASWGTFAYCFLGFLFCFVFVFLFFGLVLFDSPFLPSTAWPGPGHVCSAHSRSCPNRPESRPESATLPPPSPPPLRRHDSPAPPPPPSAPPLPPCPFLGADVTRPPTPGGHFPRQSLPSRGPRVPPVALASLWAPSQQIALPSEAGPPPWARRPVSCPWPYSVAVRGAP